MALSCMTAYRHQSDLSGRLKECKREREQVRGSSGRTWEISAWGLWHRALPRPASISEHFFLGKKNLSSRPFFLKIRSVFKRQSSQNMNQMVEKSIYHCFLSLIPSCKPNNINTTFILVIAHSAVGLLYVVKWLPSGSQRSWRPPLGTLN